MLNTPEISTAVAAIIEKSINLALKYDPATRLQLQALSGRSICIECQSPDIQLFFFLEDTQVIVNAHSDEATDVKISGNTSDFISMLGQSTHSFAESNITVSGKINVLNQLKEILSDLEIDWEQPLTEIIGILPGHALAQSIRASFNWARRQQQEVKRVLPEYLTEELRLIPAKAEINKYNQDVDMIKSAVQRLEARVQRLKNQLSTNAP
ncbi:ubiquinone biosynthesis accessory factor UbiJ [Agarilytica rhodophyticola]|uniref:ubiquinone biosynthesis accessory factor UbiJ n=1 Tax=Agarilytica rhodophyticola TaxID=1737490 RepID=UPI000B344C2E|nr:SCP2 sterol-binding domain-containing protein [Agarilytica rhodophyticola]